MNSESTERKPAPGAVPVQGAALESGTGQALSRSGKTCLLALLAVLAFDLAWCPLTDKVPRHGKGYGSQRRSEGIVPPVRFGLKRVLHNFRHFPVYWRQPRNARRRPGVFGFLTADGNSVWTNLGGHFCLSVLLCLAFLKLGAHWTWVLLGATWVNIWHEYVSEGLYCDPSYVDLWLDQAGIFLALGLFATGEWLSVRLHRLDPDEP